MQFARHRRAQRRWTRSSLCRSGRTGSITAMSASRVTRPTARGIDRLSAVWWVRFDPEGRCRALVNRGWPGTTRLGAGDVDDLTWPACTRGRAATAAAASDLARGALLTRVASPVLPCPIGSSSRGSAAGWSAISRSLTASVASSGDGAAASRCGDDGRSWWVRKLTAHGSTASSLRG